MLQIKHQVSLSVLLRKNSPVHLEESQQDDLTDKIHAYTDRSMPKNSN